MKIIVTGFFDTMNRSQRILGLIYLPIHIFILPLLLPLLQTDALTLNIIYYTVSFLFCLIVFWRYLRTAFDVLLDNKRNCVLGFFSSYVVYFALTLVVSAALVAVMGAENLTNPNNAEITELAKNSDTRVMLGLAAFLGPVAEETLFRGALFGSIRTKSRIWAYVVSIAAFAIYHVWQYAVVFGDASLLVYALQYVPVGIAFCMAYERTNCIWVPIFLHMVMNLVSMIALT